MKMKIAWCFHCLRICELTCHPPAFLSCSTCGKVVANQIKSKRSRYRASKLNPRVFTGFKRVRRLKKNIHATTSIDWLKNVTEFHKMEISSKCVSQANIVSCSTVFHSKSSLVSSSVVPFHHSSKTQLQGLRIQAKKQRNLGAIYASSEAETLSTDVSETWLLQPVGDGDTRHIGYKVEMPNAFEIASSEVTVGRVPDKAEMVIPVATVSGVHARIQKKGGKLLVTDLDSTNGTFVDNKRLKPGVVAAVSAGSCITFGDTHLAMFRVSKFEKVETPSKQELPEDQSDDSPAVSTETS